MVIGIDEVGRGAWAGPLVFAAVTLPENCSYISELKDSKKLSRSLRSALYKEIISSALYAISEIDNQEIDEMGLTKSSIKACEHLIDKLNPKNVTKIILDGNVNYLKGHRMSEKVEVVIKADESIPDVMAASIIAKHYRDTLMQKLAISYPGYDLENNVGYGTAKHIKALSTHGLTNIHRKAYKPLKSYYEH